MNIVLWWHTVGADQSIMLLKYTAALYPCCCKMPQNPLWSCTITSLSPFFHSALNTHCWLLIFPLSPPLSHPSPTSSPASTSPPISLPPSDTFSHFHLRLPLHHSTPSFSSSSPRQAITKPCMYPGGIEREGEKSGIVYKTEGDDERIRCYVWMT